MSYKKSRMSKPAFAEAMAGDGKTKFDFMKNICCVVMFVSGAFLHSCKKNGGLPDYPVNADLKAAFSFKPGSYWIYKDSISGEIDSFFVRQLVSTYNAITPNIPYTVDQVLTCITEWNTNNHADSNVWQISLIINNLYISYDASAAYLYLLSYGPGISYPFTNVYASDTVLVLNTYSLLGNNFENVVEVHYVESSPLYSDYFYLCPDIGMVKIVFNHSYDTTNRVWELQRYDIVK